MQRRRAAAWVGATLLATAAPACTWPQSELFHVTARTERTVCVTEPKADRSFCDQPTEDEDADSSLVGRAPEWYEVGSCFTGSRGHPSLTVHVKKAVACPDDLDLRIVDPDRVWDVVVRFRRDVPLRALVEVVERAGTDPTKPEVVTDGGDIDLVARVDVVDFAGSTPAEDVEAYIAFYRRQPEVEVVEREVAVGR